LYQHLTNTHSTAYRDLGICGTHVQEAAANCMRGAVADAATHLNVLLYTSMHDADSVYCHSCSVSCTTLSRICSSSSSSKNAVNYCESCKPPQHMKRQVRKQAHAEHMHACFLLKSLQQW
jgi:hypothetical protein